jgi:hypothetical protein
MTVDERIRRFTKSVPTRGERSVTGPISGAVGHFDRYLRFTRIVADRFETANAKYVEHSLRFKAMMPKEPGSGGRREMTEEESKALLDQWALGEIVSLEIESFYMFAKILLDRVADLVCLYFGHPRPGIGSSHSRLKNGIFDHICRTKSIDGQVLLPRLEDLHRRVVEHKTDVVEHLADPRWFPGLGFGGDHRVTVSMGLMGPREGETEFDTRETGDPAVLLKEIEAYVVSVIDFLEANIEKSVLGRPAKE